MTTLSKVSLAVVATAALAAAPSAQRVLTFSCDTRGEKAVFRVDGDDVVLLLNGEEAPKKRYKRSGSNHYFLDKKGSPVAQLRVRNDGGTLRTFKARKPKLRLGLTLKPPVASLREHLDLGKNEATYVAGVTKGKSAQKAGLREHDIITLIDGAKPATQKRLTEILKEKTPGDSLTLTVIRKGKPTNVTVVLEEDDSSVADLLFNVPYAGNDNVLPSLFAIQNLKNQAQTKPYLNNLFLQSAIKNQKEANNQKMKDYLPLIYGTNLGYPDKSSNEPSQADLTEQLDRLRKRLESLEGLIERLDKSIKSAKKPH